MQVLECLLNTAHCKSRIQQQTWAVTVILTRPGKKMRPAASCCVMLLNSPAELAGVPYEHYMLERSPMYGVHPSEANPKNFREHAADDLADAADPAKPSFAGVCTE